MVDPILLRPKRSSFFFDRMMRRTVLSAFIAVGASIAAFVESEPVAAIAGVAVAAMVWVFGLVGAFAAYKKERYEIHEDRIVAHSGGLFSDRQSDLAFRNVTHVRQRLPWLRYRFFDVGDVIVDSAGSGGAAVVLHNLINPDEVYALIRTRLQGNGFSLRQQQLLHQESPSTIGVFVDLVQTGLGLAFGFLVMLIPLGGAAVQASSDKQFGHPLWTVLFVSVPVFIIVSNFVGLIIRYLDLRRRTYRVHEDAIVYDEGFLTRHNAFIPFENIADADVQRTFVDQIFGLADVTISCQGSGSAIRFRRLKHEGGIKRALDRVVENAAHARSQATHDERRAADLPVGAPAHSDAPAPRQRAVMPAEQMWTATFQPRPIRAVAGLLPWLWMPLMWVPIGIAWALARAKSYQVTSTGVGASGGILSKTSQQFAYDKITGVFVRTNPLDRWFNTFTVRICSIGASRPLDIAFVRRDDVELDRLLRQMDIPASPVTHTFEKRFNVTEWARRELLLVLFLVGLSLAIVAGGVYLEEIILQVGGAASLSLSFLAYFITRARMAKQQMTLHAEHVEMRQGIFFREHAYARFDDVKKVELRNNLFSDAGYVRIFLAGERVVQGNQGQSVPVPYMLTFHFAPHVLQMKGWLDDVIGGKRVEAARADTAPRPVLASRKPSSVSVATRSFIVGIFILPLLPIYVPLRIAMARRTEYRLEQGRVVRESGLLLRKHISILTDRIDATQQNQGAIDKVFKTGKVTILTAGSSRPDWMASDILDHRGFYESVRSAS